jgi:hypothetical protein
MRLRWIIVSVTILLVLSVGLGYLLWGRSKITIANYEKINADMSLAQVQAILGPGELTEDSTKDAGMFAALERELPKEYQGKPIRVYRWRHGKNVIAIHFIGEQCEKNLFKTGSFP